MFHVWLFFNTKSVTNYPEEEVEEVKKKKKKKKTEEEGLDLH